MARFRPLGLPLFLLLISAWMIYDNWIAPNPMWRYPKAEAAGPLFFVIGIIYLAFVVYRLVRPLKIAVGMRAYFKNGDELLSGMVVAINGDDCVVRNERGDYTLNRFSIEEAAPIR